MLRRRDTRVPEQSARREQVETPHGVFGEGVAQDHAGHGRRLITDSTVRSLAVRPLGRPADVAAKHWHGVRITEPVTEHKLARPRLATQNLFGNRSQEQHARPASGVRCLVLAQNAHAAGEVYVRPSQLDGLAGARSRLQRETERTEHAVGQLTHRSQDLHSIESARVAQRDRQPRLVDGPLQPALSPGVIHDCPSQSPRLDDAGRRERAWRLKVLNVPLQKVARHGLQSLRRLGPALEGVNRPLMRRARP